MADCPSCGSPEVEQIGVDDAHFKNGKMIIPKRRIVACKYDHVWYVPVVEFHPEIARDSPVSEE